MNFSDNDPTLPPSHKYGHECHVLRPNPFVCSRLQVVRFICGASITYQRIGGWAKRVNGVLGCRALRCLGPGCGGPCASSTVNPVFAVGGRRCGPGLHPRRDRGRNSSPAVQGWPTQSQLDVWGAGAGVYYNVEIGEPRFPAKAEYPISNVQVWISGGRSGG